MSTIKFENLPEVIGMMAEQINRIDVNLNKKTPPKEPSNKKYNLAEAAAYCGMAKSTFRTYIYNRRVAGIKFGKAWLFLQSDLDAFISDFRKPTIEELKSQGLDELF